MELKLHNIDHNWERTPSKGQSDVKVSKRMHRVCILCLRLHFRRHVSTMALKIPRIQYTTAIQWCPDEIAKYCSVKPESSEMTTTMKNHFIALASCCLCERKLSHLLQLALSSVHLLHTNEWYRQLASILILAYLFAQNHNQQNGYVNTQCYQW